MVKVGLTVYAAADAPRLPGTTCSRPGLSLQTTTKEALGLDGATAGLQYGREIPLRRSLRCNGFDAPVASGVAQALLRHYSGIEAGRPRQGPRTGGTENRAAAAQRERRLSM